MECWHRVFLHFKNVVSFSLGRTEIQLSCHCGHLKYLCKLSSCQNERLCRWRHTLRGCAREEDVSFNALQCFTLAFCPCSLRISAFSSLWLLPQRRSSWDSRNGTSFRTAVFLLITTGVRSRERHYCAVFIHPWAGWCQYPKNVHSSSPQRSNLRVRRTFI